MHRQQTFFITSQLYAHNIFHGIVLSGVEKHTYARH